MLLQLPFFDEVEKAQNILIAGAGGGFDIFCGLPLYFALRDAGKSVHLANLSFSDITGSTGRFLTPNLLQVTADTQGNENYFPELHLARWFRSRDEEVPIFSFEKTGVRPMLEGYELLAKELALEAIILIDGGTDSLMRGDEAGLGTPVEDIASIMAVNKLDVSTKLVVCIGFGVDAFHGVCHAHFLEAVAAITHSGGFLGMWSLMQEMPEVQLYQQAVSFVARRMPHHPSIVSSSILSAIEGHFGDYHSTHRTQNNKLFINPLMALQWCFHLDAVAKRVLYPKTLMKTESANDIQRIIEQFRYTHTKKPYEDLPM